MIQNLAYKTNTEAANTNIKANKLNSLSNIITEPYASSIKSLDEISNFDVNLIGGKAANLAKLKQAGIRVPPGYVFDTTIFNTYTSNKQLPITIQKIITSIREILGRAVALRSSANGEDGEQISMAGVFETFYVPITDNTQQVIEKTEKLYQQSISKEVKEYTQLHNIQPNQMKMALIVQKLVQSEYSGVIYTNPKKNEILIGYCKGFGDQLVDQKTSGSSLLINSSTRKILQSRGFDQAPLDQKIIQQLINVSLKISQLYNHTPQDIEFAIEKGELYILQSRPLTKELGAIKLEETPNDTLNKAREDFKAFSAKEKELFNTSSAIFSSSNFSELLPHPASMDYTIFATILTGRKGSPGAFQLARQDIGYIISDKTIGFMQRIGGHTYYSLTKDALTFYGAFPETEQEYIENTVAYYLKKVNENPDLGFYPEMILYEQFPTLAWFEKHYGKKRAPNLLNSAKKFNDRMDREAISFSLKLDEKIVAFKNYIKKMKSLDTAQMTAKEKIGYINEIVQFMRTSTCVDFIKSARFGFYYTRKLQVLFKEAGLDDVDSAVAKLGQGLDNSAVTEANLAIEQANDIEQAMIIAREKVGFYSEGEALEIRHPRLIDTPEALRAYVEGIRDSGIGKNWREQREKRLKFELELEKILGKEKMTTIMPAIRGCQKNMAMRETLKCLFTEKYSLVRKSLVNLAHEVEIPEEDIFHLEIEELNLLIKDPDNMKHIITSRKQHFKNEPLLELPKVIREEDIEKLHLKTAFMGSFTSQKGHFLADGPTLNKAIIVNVDEIGIGKTLDKIKEFKDTPLVLVAKQMNLTHDPLISKVSGLILGNASIVSHGAQRARELGKGALGGFIVEQLTTGMQIYFSPKDRLVKKQTLSNVEI
ncbi:PEP/pyruvate-binding domain-containing protein [Tenacibaculum amylolyticum]|uniref:PEP/pyruvate-binding domain-containing protein n=1 Tax=Tenacibaculum amylolyticum TaxID=104269 RepID=UPI003895AD78